MRFLNYAWPFRRVVEELNEWFDAHFSETGLTITAPTTDDVAFIEVWNETDGQFMGIYAQGTGFDPNAPHAIYFESSVGPLLILGTELSPYMSFSKPASIQYVDISDATRFRVMDGGNTDYAQFRHTGTDFLTEFTNTNDWVISGLTGDIVLTSILGNFVDDAAASAGSVPVGGLYRNGSVVMIRVA